MHVSSIKNLLLITSVIVIAVLPLAAVASYAFIFIRGEYCFAVAMQRPPAGSFNEAKFAIEEQCMKDFSLKEVAVYLKERDYIHNFASQAYQYSSPPIE